MPAPFEQSAALSSLVGIRHGFFGRRGGVSTGDLASLNVSETAGDRPGHVAENRALAAGALGFAPAALAVLKQVHSASVFAIGSLPAGGALPEGDGLVTAVPGVVLGILTADCAPVLLADREAGVIGAFHAGWRGAVEGIAPATLGAMVALGADPARTVAAIGPCISLANYEVGPEFAASLLARHPDAANRLQTGPAGREHFDLPGFVFDQLHAAGVARVEDLARCTYGAPKHYFSHRYATHRGTAAGRQIALIGLSPAD